jgi:hypothetical protein
MTDSERTPRLLDGTRGMRYGEVLLATFRDGAVDAEVYNSFPQNDCPDDLWRALDPVALAAEFGATVAILNGPRYWLMDGIGKVDVVVPVMKEFGGIAMRRLATLTLTDFERRPYKEISVNRGAQWFFNAGSLVHQLHTSDGRTFIMQAYCTGIDETMSMDTLSSLGSRLSLPEGWTYDSGITDHEIVVDTTDRLATVLQDEFENTYSLTG